MSKILGIFVTGLLMCPPPALAQAVPDWAGQIKPGKPLFVTTMTGDRVDGDVSQVASDVLVLKTADGIRSVSYRDVRKVEKRDGVSNGVWTGVAIGVAGGAAILFTPGGADADAANRAGTVLASAGWGALIGWGIDAAVKGRETVFDADRVDAAVSVSPQRGGFIARVAITW